MFALMPVCSVRKDNRVLQLKRASGFPCANAKEAFPQPLVVTTIPFEAPAL